MKVGIIGYGVVGKTLDYGFTRLGHEIVVYSKDQRGSDIENVIKTEIVFICVPTPQRADGSCDTGIVENVVQRLYSLNYRGLVVIKSTVPPGTTDKLKGYYPFTRIAFCPEFLREKSTYSDFVEHHDVCIIGAHHVDHAELIKDVHDPLPKSYAVVSPIEAEFAKYFSNVYNATRIIFANQFFEVCKAAGVDYKAVKDAISQRSNVGSHYLDCNDNFRGYGGACLPKDIAAFTSYAESLNANPELFRLVMKLNNDLTKGKA